MNENKYSFKELLQKYHLNATSRMTTNQVIRFFELRGIKIELIEIKKTAYYKILNDTIFNYNWVIHPTIKKFEACKEGFVRLSDSKRLVGGSDGRDGYLIIKNSERNGNFYIHRLIMETFCPIENSNDFVVDHINGKRDDNRLENLRWLTQRQNSEARDINFIKLNKNYQKLILKYGYDKLNDIFQSLLNS